MNNLNKLSRAEMKNVTGGVIKYCVMRCVHDNFVAVIYVNDCTADSLAACNFGGQVLSCICDVM
jgi:predicted enzyme related to lactoylglutathione lyase